MDNENRGNMMKRKLEAVLCDLDGSLLNSDKLISDEDLGTIHRLKENGVHVHIVSGRAAAFCRQNADEIGFDSLVSCCNGGYIYDFSKEEIVCHGQLLDSRDVLSIRNYCISHGISYLIYSLEGVFFDRPDSRRTLFWKQQSEEHFSQANKIVFRYDSEDLDFSSLHFVKILLCYVTKEDAENVRHLFNKENRYEIVFSEKNLLDINAVGTNKGHAVEELAKTVGFNLRNTIVLGDNFNDEMMLKKAGYPIVPENGEEDMKKLAFYITSDNNDSPLSKAIRECFPDYL